MFLTDSLVCFSKAQYSYKCRNTKTGDLTLIIGFIFDLCFTGGGGREGGRGGGGGGLV